MKSKVFDKLKKTTYFAILHEISLVFGWSERKLAQIIIIQLANFYYLPTSVAIHISKNFNFKLLSIREIIFEAIVKIHVQ